MSKKVTKLFFDTTNISIVDCFNAKNLTNYVKDFSKERTLQEYQANNKVAPFTVFIPEMLSESSIAEAR
jgi:hypothetical protein